MLIHHLESATCSIRLQFPDAEVNITSLTLASRTSKTLSVTWSAGYPKCYSFTVSHSNQDGSINVTQPADSDTSHTLTSLLPGTTYRIEVEAVRKGEGADRQRARVMGNFTTDGAYVELPSQSFLRMSVLSIISCYPTCSDTALANLKCPSVSFMW